MDDIRALAEILARQLAPFLPQLFKVGDKALEGVGKKLGGGAVEGVGKLWRRVLGESAAERAAKKLVEAPSDSRRAGAFEAEIEEILDSDRGLAADLARLLEAAGPTVVQVHDGVVAWNRGVAAEQVAVGGNVHGDIYIGGAEKPPTAPATLRTAYLERLMEQVGFLDLAGIDLKSAEIRQDTRLSLDAVYTALLAKTTFVPLDPFRAEPAGRVPLRRSALALLNRHKRLVLLGDPGSGKSIFVNFVTLCFAGETLKRRRINLDRLTAPLPAEEGTRDEPQQWEHPTLLPVRVVLRDLAACGLLDTGEKGTARHLLEFLELELKAARLEGFLPLLEQELREHGGLVLLDGLDEVPEAERRRVQIRDIVQSFVEGFSKCRVLLTSRTYAYQSPAWRLPNFAEAVLAPFTDGQISRFISCWYAHIAPLRGFSQKEATSRAKLLDEVISRNDRLRELAERPLLLTLMASLHAWRQRLPEKREQLYAEAVDLLLDRWEGRQSVRGHQEPGLAEWLEVEQKGRIRQVLEKLAYEAHAAQPDSASESTADVSAGALVEALIQINRNPEANPVKLVHYLWHRTGLLTERKPGIYTFPHRTFQEYLAACHLTRVSYPDLLAKSARKDPDRWREVLLLAAAKEPASVWYLADALCWREEPEDTEAGSEDVWGAHLAGRAVLEVPALEGISDSNQPKLKKLRRWHVRLIGDSELPARERALAGKSLALFGDPRFDPERWYLPRGPMLGFVKVPAGPFLMGSDKERDFGAWGDELPQHEVVLPEYWMARYPVTVAQFRVFLEARAYEPKGKAEGAANVPVSGVTWYDSLAYCRWLGGELKEWAKSLAGEGRMSLDEQALWKEIAAGRLSVTVPSEAEWEKAARGTDGRIFPWGDREDPDLASYGESGIGEPSAVGCFPGGKSTVGCEEMSGNVLEWTRSLDREYPYERAEGRENLSEHAQGRRVLRGGSCLDNSGRTRCACRLRGSPSRRVGYVGFRVVLSPFFSGL